MRVAVIGDADIITGFSLIGVKDVFATDAKQDEVQDAFKAVIKDSSIGIIVISHSLAELIREDIKRLNLTKKIIPVIVEVPDKGSTEVFDPFEELIKKAVGVNI